MQGSLSEKGSASVFLLEEDRDTFLLAAGKNVIICPRHSCGFMASNLKIPFALRNGVLVHISEIESGRHLDCLCPNCQNVLVARKGTLKRHHFAHDVQPESCSYESAIHRTAKLLVYDALNRAIQNKTALPMKWKCQRCNDTHERNLVGKAGGVALEYSLETCRPDVLLFNTERKPIAAIEIVVSHPPEQESVSYYQANNIALITLVIKTENDLLALRNPEVVEASTVNSCLRAKCPKCREPLHQKKLYVVTDTCEKCRRPITLAFFIEDRREPADFSKSELDMAQQLGWQLRMEFNGPSANGKYPSNACPHCRKSPRFINFWHLADDSNGVETGWYCQKCDWKDQ